MIGSYIMAQESSIADGDAERVKRVISDVRILLEGCKPVQERIEFLLEELERKLNKGETHIVKDTLAALVRGLSECSSDYITDKSIEDALRVEVVNRVLFSALQKFQDPSEMLAHLEKLTQEPDNLKAQILDYGYEGITLTTTGNFQLATTEFMGCGEHALHDANALEPSLVDEMIRFWFWGHWLRIGNCLTSWGMYEESLPWFEASLRVASRVSKYPAPQSENAIGRTLVLVSEDIVNSTQKEEIVRSAVTHMENSIHLFKDSLAKGCPVAHVASKTIYPCADSIEKGSLTAGVSSTVAELYAIIGQQANDVLKDFTLSLDNFAKGAKTFAAIEDRRAESICWFKYATVLMEYMPDKLEEVRSYYRQSLEAGLKVSRRTSGAQSAVHNASMYLQHVIMRLMPSRESEILSYFPCVVGKMNPFIHPDLDNYPPSWTMARARAELVLGIDYFHQRKYEEAITMLLLGLTTLDDEPQTDETGKHWSRHLSAIIHAYLGRLNHIPAVGNHKEAAKHFHLSGQLHDDPKTKVRESLREVSALYYCDECARALEVVKGFLLTESDMRAGLLACKGYLEYWMGEFEESILSLEKARKLYQDNKDFECKDLAYVHICLIHNYLVRNDYWAAANLVKAFQPVIDSCHKGGHIWHTWQVMKAIGHQMVGDVREANRVFEQLEFPQLSMGKQRPSLLEIGARAAVYRVENDLDSALEQYATMEEKVGEILNMTQVKFAEIGLNRNVALADIALSRAATLLRDADNEEHLEECVKESQQAALLFKKEEGQSIQLARALACQAAALFNLKIIRHPRQCPGPELHLIDEAIQLARSRDRLLLAKCKHIKALIMEAEDPSSAEAEGREAALIFAELQLQLKDMESAWVTMFGSDMRHQFLFMQTLMLNRHSEPLKALLWAERGRMRLFVHNSSKQHTIEDWFTAKSTTNCNSSVKLDKPDETVDAVNGLTVEVHGLGQTSCSEEERLVESGHEHLSGSDDLSFDRDDGLAEQHLFQAVAECGPGALILEYTFAQDHGIMYIYAVFIDSGERMVVKCESTFDQVNEKLAGKRKWGKTLTALIHKTRELIVRKMDTHAIEGLSLLHSLLIEPVQKHVKSCKKLILGTHELLALVPFAALYDTRSGKFLIQEKTISYIPSIRVLNHCFYRQQEFERDVLEGLLSVPFIAGNPEPMGWGQTPLPAATKEAEVVAQILGVESCTGPDMNKEAVKNGLSNGSMVLLATHGVVNTYFPHGALILRGRGTSPPRDESATLMSRGLGFHKMRNSSTLPIDDNADAAISSDEIASLPRGIRAGLVALSACKSAHGEVTSEGVLGLGRALLQGGAASAILTLWDVNDSSTKVLISAMFEQLVKEGQDVAQALRLAMLQMMEDKETKYTINHWAPMIVFGSPLFRYITPARKPLVLAR